ncbi:hypothetical protein [Saccharopolyspora rectivirgula]|jgi:hypothetical protein|uniref:Uncharacterized protein n=1 Tax=Saccharopolyspora rectivirgula TaxID=28042 RepID=A0A073B1A3_9PSEU|nr:hypothetical protein [Saccharopolyspora rectivirgula]KEI45405.1 hypothetical protein GU90_04690 [Saccharopolyspora rectivirgula]
MLNIQLEYPPGFAGLSIAGTTEQQLRERAQSLVNAAAQHGDIDPAELTDQLMAVCERLNRFRILVFGAFPTQTAQPATATMTLASAPLRNAEGVATGRDARSALATALLEEYQRRHPHADARVVRLPAGPSIAAVHHGELRLPAGEFGLSQDEVRPVYRAEFQFVSPDARQLAVLDVTTGSADGWEYVAGQAARTARSLRFAEQDEEG